MMVLAVAKYDIQPDKFDAYIEWARSAIPEIMAVPGIRELRSYRPIAGAGFIIVTAEFASLADYAAWAESETMVRIINERRTFSFNETSELWGASPTAPDPIRPNA
jgi:heme-degrading monooxygenase HmoA